MRLSMKNEKTKEMRVKPFSVREIVIPTSFTEVGQAEQVTVNLAGCENCATSQYALNALANPSPNLLIDHWQSQDKTLRNKLGELHDVNPEQIFLTSGALAGIGYTFDVFVDQGTKVGLLRPDFPGFVHFAEKKRVDIKRLENTQFPFGISNSEIIKFARENELGFTILSNPNAITGTLRRKEEITDLLESNPETLFVIDEADSIYPHLEASNLSRKYNNGLFLGSFSKFYGLSGLRVGYLITPEEYIPHFKRTISPVELTSMAIVAATASFDDKNYQAETQRRVEKNLSTLEQACNGTNYQLVPGSKCFATYLWADDGVEDPAKTLRNYGIEIAKGYGEFNKIGSGGRVNLSDGNKIGKLVEAIENIHKRR